MEEYYSIKQIADSLNVSKQRVYRCIKANHINEVHHDIVKGNTVMMYDKACVDRIKELLSTSSEAHREPHQEVHRDTHNDTVNDTLYDTLVKQLEIKDNQIKELNERLKEVNRSLQQEQQLHLLSKQRVIELEKISTEENSNEPEKDIENEPETDKRTFWQKLFHWQ